MLSEIIDKINLMLGKKYICASDKLILKDSNSILYSDIKQVLAYYSAARTETCLYDNAVPEAYIPKKDAEGNDVPYQIPSNAGKTYVVSAPEMYVVLITTHEHIVSSVIFGKNEKKQCIELLTELEDKIGKSKVKNKESVLNDIPETIESLWRFFE